ncbi:MAG: orotidine 5-phosphate decarboxylase [Microbacteriaceae bacterium]|nr:orotidine 5-phosphate decarboxylase [Microbacteriaceae bacterium]
MSDRPAAPDRPGAPTEGAAAGGFGGRLRSAFDRHGQLCVGIDPHSFLLADWGLADSADGAREFGLRVVDAAVGTVGIVKPQVAFFERYGAAGFGALESVLAAARAAGLLVIADAKRGDLGTSVEAYGQAWLTPGSPLEADALTISAYMGVGSIERPMRLAEETGKGLFVLAATSNPEALAVQTATLVVGARAGKSVAASIVEDVGEWNAAQAGRKNATDGTPATGDGESTGTESTGTASTEGVTIGSIGLVLGATVDFGAFGIDLAVGEPATPILAPGFGHQGARFGDLGALYGPSAPFAVVSASRSILRAGPDRIAEAIRAQAGEVFACRA